MTKRNNAGVYQKSNGFWEYRFTIVVDGQQISRKKSTDEFGNKLKTKSEAIRAREAAIFKARTDRERQREIKRKKVKEVFQEYCEKGRNGKAYNTILKQDSLWKNHIKERFGDRFIDEISVAEIDDYLSELYYIDGLSFSYVESFLKMFYLIFGQAYSRNYLDVDTYNKLCLNKGTKISMPKLKTEDDTDIVAFSREELALLDEYFKGTNAETAYLLGRYCGLRINETFGLKWNNVNIENGTITIDRQMQYQEGLIKLVAPKTKNANRTIYMNEKLKRYFIELSARRRQDEIQFAALREQNQRFIEDVDGQKIYSTELVNCLPNGKIQTNNSFKYPTREIRECEIISVKLIFL